MLKADVFRKPGLPILMVEFPDGRRVPYWNTFYQEVHGRDYLGQMDLNIKSERCGISIVKHLKNSILRCGYCAA